MGYVSSVTNMSNMFRNAHCFQSNHRQMGCLLGEQYGLVCSAPLVNSTNPSATGMCNGHQHAIMFSGAASFQPAHRQLGYWQGYQHEGNVFTATKFNQPIGNWDVSAVTIMDNHV